MLLKILILQILFLSVLSFSSMKKDLIHEFTDADESGTLDITGWTPGYQRDCGGVQIVGFYGTKEILTKTYSNLPVHDFVEISFKLYLVDDPQYQPSNSNIADIIVFKINNEQEEIINGQNGQTPIIIQQGNICRTAGRSDIIVQKKFEQFTYQKNSLDLEFQTYYSDDVQEAWGIRDINVKLYTIQDVSEVHSITDLQGDMSNITGWNPSKTEICDGHTIFGRFGLTESSQKTYTNIPEYRYAILNLDVYEFDSLDPDDQFFGYINDNLELYYLGKGFQYGPFTGQRQICGRTDTDDVMFNEIIKVHYPVPKTEMKVQFRSEFTEIFSGEGWALKDFTLKFYNYVPYCPSPFIFTDDLTECVCPVNAYPNSTEDDCIFCQNNEVANGTLDGCVCNIGAIANFDTVNCTCTGDFDYDTNSGSCICSLSIPNYFDSNTCLCENTFIFNGDKSECICPAEQIVRGGICQNCSTGEYYSNNQCLNCDNSVCATCQNNSTECILGCNSGCLTCDTDGSCLTCSLGQYLESDDSCQPCDNTQCATCSGTSTTCGINCNLDCQQCGVDGSCTACEDGKYLSGGQCLDCDNTQCATCSGNSTTCGISCNSGCQQCGVDGLCTSCADGKYLSGGQCLDCDNTQCATCSGTSTTCGINCNLGCQQCGVDGSCTACEDGKYLSGGQCLDCDNTQCATCSGTSTTCGISCNSGCQQCGVDGSCTSCADGKYLSGGQCLDCDNTQCATCNTNSQNCDQQCNADCATCNVLGQCISCDLGEFLSGIQCLTCDQTVCATCQNSSQECILECNSDCQECGINGLCTGCVDGQYLSGGQCLKCDSTQCGTCETNNDNCLVQCQSGCKNCGVTGSCVDCLDGDYLTNTQTCESCDFQCSTCTDQSDNCLTCSDTQTRDINNNCDCKIGYYQISQNIVCGECSFKCGSCQNSENECITCVNDSRSNPPNCDCAVGYYDDESTGDCQQCKYNCACVIYEYCSQCLQQDSDLRNPLDCSCKTGYYSDSDGNCQKCNSKCQECESSSNNCIICNSINSRDQQAPQCDCKSGFYENQNTQQCQKCPSQCSKCDQNQQCTECLIKFMRPPLCFNFFSSFFEIDTQQDIELTDQQCNVQCLKCQNSQNNCTECQVGLNRTFEIPKCGCEYGYHDNNNQLLDCLQCPILCESCKSQDECIRCKGNSILNHITLLCECSYGFKLDIQGQSCVKCYNYEGTCHFKCPLNTIQDEKTKKCLKVNYEAQSYIVIYYICFSLFLLAFIGITVVKLNRFLYSESFQKWKPALKNQKIEELDV